MKFPRSIERDEFRVFFLGGDDSSLVSIDREKEVIWRKISLLLAEGKKKYIYFDSIYLMDI